MQTSNNKGVEPPASVLGIVKDFQPSMSPSKPKPTTPGYYNSLYEWWGTKDFDQSTKIKCGIVCQSLIEEIVKQAPVKPTKQSADTLIKVSAQKVREADILFNLKNKVVYREVRANMNLDSEKMPASIQKINTIVRCLEDLHPKSTIDGKFLCPTRLESEGLIEGLNDFLDLLGYNKLSVKDFDKIGEIMGKKVRALM